MPISRSRATDVQAVHDAGLVARAGTVTEQSR
jgi:hypothetical protein